MRVVGGQLRGRRLHAPAGQETRPTGERARTGLFDWIEAQLRNASVLDLYAGTGALGIEALSRGAAHAVFVERSRAARKALERNLADLELGACSHVLSLGVDRAIRGFRRRRECFDLILADPPYEARVATELRGLAILLSETGIAVLERSRRAEPAFGAGEGDGRLGLRWIGAKVYGETAFDSYERMNPEAGGGG